MFRSPVKPELFSVLIATGFQLNVVALIFLFISSFGMQLGAHMREFLFILFMILITVTGSLRSYIAARLYKLFNGTRWRLLTMQLSLMPLVGFVFFVILPASTTDPKHLTAARLIDTYLFTGLWLICDVPSVLIGCYLGYSAEKIKVPAKISRVHRTVPEAPFYTNKFVMILAGAILIGSTMVSEVHYLVETFWTHQYYDMYLQLFSCFILMMNASGTIAIV